MKYINLLLASVAIAVYAAPSNLNTNAALENRAVGSIYVIPLNGSLGPPGVYNITGAKWNVTSETGIGAKYGQSATKKLAADLAHIAAQPSTAQNNPMSISASQPGASGGKLNGTFVKTNWYFGWGMLNTTQWNAIFDTSVKAITTEGYPKNSNYSFLISINGYDYYQDGFLTVTYHS